MKKALTSDDFSIPIRAIDSPPQRSKDIFEYLHGREPQYPVHNIEGIPVALEGVVYKQRTGRWELEYRLGDQVYRAASIQPGDPGIKAVQSRMTVVGPPAHEVEKQRQLEQEERKRQEANERYIKERQLYAEALRAEREAADQRRREEQAARG